MGVTATLPKRICEMHANVLIKTLHLFQILIIALACRENQLGNKFPIVYGVGVTAASLGDFEQCGGLFFRHEPQGFAQVVDVVFHGGAPVIADGVSLGEGFGHDGHQPDPLVEYVVHRQMMKGIVIRRAAVTEKQSVGKIAGDAVRIADHRLPAVMSEGASVQKGTGH